jgi:hypothetical protein
MAEDARTGDRLSAGGQRRSRAGACVPVPAGAGRRSRAHRGEQADGGPWVSRSPSVPGRGRGAGSPGPGSAYPPAPAAVKVKSTARGGSRVAEGVRPGDRRAVSGVPGAGPRPPGVRVPVPARASRRRKARRGTAGPGARGRASP